MKTYSIVVGLAIFKLNEKNPSVGMTRTSENHLVLPSALWCDTGTLEATARYLLRGSVYVDEHWCDLEEIGNIEVMMNETHCSIMSVWRTYVPDSIETNPEIEWVEYGKLENIGTRIVRHHLKALRRAFNR